MSNAPRLTGAIALLVLVGTLVVAARPVGPLPPLGRFLDPVHGIWSVARGARLPAAFTGSIASLEGAVRVQYDRRGVPHIWASSIEDAMRALGYVVARDRLFQLELQTLAVAGRLTEVLGTQALEADRAQRALGLAWAAERAVVAQDPASQAARVGAAYAEGVNAWIDQMRSRDLPFEYHLLGVRPQRWEPLHSAYLMKRMGYTLTYSNHELWRVRVEKLIGKAATKALFPQDSPIQEPIQPNGRNAPRLDFHEPPAPRLEQRDAYSTAAGQLSAARIVSDRVVAGLIGSPAPGIGSNNWAVAPARSASGHALLAGDPHLELTLPSIWYETHLVVPGQLDVYGVTIPGTPGVIIGFNRDVSWSMTNTGADVLDFYREQVDSTERPTKYRVDGVWLDLEVRVEEYRDRGGDVIAVDTNYFTHRGPLVRTDDGFLSMRWTVLEDTQATDALLDGTRTASVDEFLKATETFLAPAQNMIMADRGGNIAIRSTGRYPLRPSGDGWQILDGTTSAADWSGEWPVARYPYALNPGQGFLASANQQPKDPRVDREYLGLNWPSPWRAMRINQLLRGDSAVTPDAMRRYQTDPGNARADWFVPVFLEAAEHVLHREQNARLEEAATLLGEWDRRYRKDNDRAVLFELAMDQLADRTWDELVPTDGDRRIATPASMILAQLTEFPGSTWWDRIDTPGTNETRDDILAESLVAALELAYEWHGPPDSGGWRWERVRHENIWHLARIAALSSLQLPVQGGPGSLNPSSGRGVHGASWRMVVEMGPEVRAWAIYPGGQSGNPASDWYDDRIPAWVEGELDAVLFPREPSDLAAADVAGSLVLGGGQ